jgi:CoA:oxalate CoA-transferase
VLGIDELMEDPQYRARGFFQGVDHPLTGPISYPGAPFRMSQTRWRLERPAPLLGEHNEEIYLGRLGLSKGDLVRLREIGAI